MICQGDMTSFHFMVCPDVSSSNVSPIVIRARTENAVETPSRVVSCPCSERGKIKEMWKEKSVVAVENRTRTLTDSSW